MALPEAQLPDEGATAVAPTSERFELMLYVTGQTVRTERAVANLRRICERLGSCELTIVDVLERPGLAEDEKVLATPTAIRRRPLPARRVIGDLSDTGRVILGLGLPLLAAGTEEEAATP
jgi:circadian clock protein KaiB